MGSDHLVTNAELFAENQIMSVVDHVHGLQHSTSKSDSFVVDMQRFSHLIETDSSLSANPRITLQRNLSRKGSIRAVDHRKVVSSNERDVSLLATSPRATLHGGGSMPEKQALVVPGPGPHDQSTPAQVHHQITITNGSISSSVAAAAESKGVVGRRSFSFRRSSPIIDPRRILFFFATLSCMGTIMLIYFTLSMGGGKLKGDDISNLS